MKLKDWEGSGENAKLYSVLRKERALLTVNGSMLREPVWPSGKALGW